MTAYIIIVIVLMCHCIIGSNAVEPAENTTTQKVVHDIYSYYTTSAHPSNGSCADICQQFWIDVTANFGSKRFYNLTSRTAVDITLDWPFLFYGHYVKNVTLAAGGFLHMNEFTSALLTKTRYLAPFMAHFSLNPSVNTSGIRYAANDTVIVFEWNNMCVNEKMDTKYTFQAQLFRTGRIVFVYREIPILIKDLSDENHDIKAGLSDGYKAMDTLYEYDTVDVSGKVKQGVVIEIHPVPTCIEIKDCATCLDVNRTYFECEWCEVTQLCSNGFDRHKVDWFKTCHATSEKNVTFCPVVNTTTTTLAPVVVIPNNTNATTTTPATVPPPVTAATPATVATKASKPSADDPEAHAPATTTATTTAPRRSRPATYSSKGDTYPCNEDECHPVHHDNTSSSGATTVAVLVVVIFAALLIGGVFYFAYKNPSSRIGMYLIQVRTTCCRGGSRRRSAEDYQVFVESDTESMPL